MFSVNLFTDAMEKNKWYKVPNTKLNRRLKVLCLCFHSFVLYLLIFIVIKIPRIVVLYSVLKRYKRFIVFYLYKVSVILKLFVKGTEFLIHQNKYCERESQKLFEIVFSQYSFDQSFKRFFSPGIHINFRTFLSPKL